MRDMSRMSFTSLSSRSLFCFMSSKYSSFSSCDTRSSGEASKLLNPTMALSGVRISWLILARNDSLMSASSMRLRARMSSSSRSFISSMLMSRPKVA